MVLRVSAKNAFYAQSGGVSSVINASACAVIETARQHRGRIARVFAGRDGIAGALGEDLIDTSTEDTAAIAALRHTPGGAFGSCRYKLPQSGEDRGEYERIMAVFQAHDIAYFFYNGGGDSADTCAKLSRYANAQGIPLQLIHIPKTVDNDLPGTDVCPGFGSVAKYVAVSLREACLDVRAMAHTSTKVFVIEVMGRHAGWIAAAGGLAEDPGQDLPLVLLFPERRFDQEAFLSRVRDRVENAGYCAVVVAEGVRWPGGHFLSTPGGKDAFGHTQLGGAGAVIANMVRTELGYKPHWALADYLQRSARHISSAVDVAQAYAVGERAVELALEGTSGVMVSIVRTSDAPYTWELGTVPLEEATAEEKHLPADYIGADGFSITPECRRYLAPLIEGEEPPPFVAGLPQYVQLQNRPEPKKLPPFPPAD